jgi:glycosyltransferase involved in cell wall biosynthesis
MKVVLFAQDPVAAADDSLLSLLGGDCRRGPLHNGPVECYSVGQNASASLLQLIRWSLKAIWTRIRHGARTFCYSLGGADRRGLYRDWLVIALCRPFFRHVVLDWRRSGRGDWLERRGRFWERFISNKLFDRAELAIVPSISTLRDALWFRCRRAEVIPPSTDPPQKAAAWKAALTDHPVAARATPRLARAASVLQIFNRYLEIGGEEKSVARIGDDIALGGHRVERFYRESAEWYAPGAPPKWKRGLLVWRNEAVLDQLTERHRACKADCWVVHNFLPVISLGLYRRAAELGVPVIQFLHNYRPISPSGSLFAGGHRLEPDDPWIAWKESLAGSWRGSRLLTALLGLGFSRLRARGDFRAIGAWVAVSQQMREIFLRAGWPRETTYALRHSWHTSARPIDEPDEGYFLFLGRMVESKGVRFLVDLFRQPELRNLRLVMAGEGELVEELRAVSPPNVEWIGFVAGDAKKQVVARSRAVLFPSLWDEPLSTIAYEAYESSRPMIASRQGGMKEIVFDGTTGLLLDPGDSHGWTTAILQMTKERAVELGRKGREWLIRETSPRIWSERFDVILGRVLADFGSDAIVSGTKETDDGL